MRRPEIKMEYSKFPHLFLFITGKPIGIGYHKTIILMKKTLLLLSLMIASVMSVNAQGGYRGFFEVTPSLGHGVSFDVTTAHGWQFNQNWFLGAGVGAVNILNTYEGPWFDMYSETLSVPIFAKVRFDLLSEKALTWFADLNIGYVVYQDDDVYKPYSSFSVGARHRLTERFGLNFGVGCSVVPSVTDYEDNAAFKFNVKIGVDF